MDRESSETTGPKVSPSAVGDVVSTVLIRIVLGSADAE